MPRLTDDEKLAALEKRKADIRAAQIKLNRELRAVQSRKKHKARSDDARRKIIAGALALEHTAKNRDSEFARIMFRLLDEYARAEDRWLFDFLPPQDAPGVDSGSRGIASGSLPCYNRPAVEGVMSEIANGDKPEGRSHWGNPHASAFVFQMYAKIVSQIVSR